MLSVELHLNRKLLGIFKYKKAVTVKQIITEQKLPVMDTITFKLNNEFVNSDKLIAEDCVLECVGFDSEEGFRIYQDSTIFIVAKAFHILFSEQWSLIVKHSIGDGIYCEVEGKEIFTEDHLTQLKAKTDELIKRERYIEKVELSVFEAIEIFKKQSRKDVIRHLPYNLSGFTTVFKCGDYYDYYIRQLCDNTGVIKEYELNYNKPGFCIRFPLITTRKVQPEFHYPKKLFLIHQEADKWLDILDNHYIADINEKVSDLSIGEDILIEEALHEKKIVGFAEEICKDKNIKAVLIAGPSSSGKTTFTKRLSVQLHANGIKPIIIGLDEYFHPRDKSPRKENGEFDLESIRAIDLELFNCHLEQLLNGDVVELPKFDFLSGTRLRSDHTLSMNDKNILLIEGIHGLNDQLTEAIPCEQKKKIYISCLNQLNIDYHNRIATTYFRKIRRVVRDNYFRGYSAEGTLERWESISEGEQVNIFPFQENADFIFNSGLTFEVNVLKKHALSPLHRISRYSPMYTEAQKLIFLIEHAVDIPDDLVPSNSIIKEFIGGSVFKY